MSARTAALVASALAVTAVSTVGAAASARSEPGLDRGPEQAAAARPSAPARLLVAASEFRFTLSRARIQRGRAIVQLLNRGEDDHDLRLRRVSSRRAVSTARWAVTRPGDLSQLSLRLSPGRYRLWCSLPSHRTLGMRTVLRVSGEH